MSARSHKEMMREALRITEGNLSSLIGVRYQTGLSEDSSVDVRILTIWRQVVRKALGHINESDECLCPKCGLRHGGRSRGGPEF